MKNVSMKGSCEGDFFRVYVGIIVYFAVTLEITRTTISRGIEIMEGLRGHTSGYTIPTYVVDLPGGGGKVPVTPAYVLSQTPGKVVLRNYEGFISTYHEPLDYDPHAIDHLDEEASQRTEPHQGGILGLLRGEANQIKPAGHHRIKKAP
jgi:lysine 2,3-aminomutase